MSGLVAVVDGLLTLLVACGPHYDDRGAEACHDASPQRRWAQIDSLMQQRPDSALALLLDCRDGVHTVSTNPTDRHYYQLLLAEALYKNDSAQANRRELQQAMAYFDSLCGCTDVARNVSTNLAFLSARAHYMNGVGYYQNDSAGMPARNT